jgi:hypothetical protein
MAAKAVTEAQLIQLAEQVRLTPKPTGRRTKNVEATEYALVAMGAGEIMAKFKKIGFKYADAIELFDAIRKSPDATSAARLAALSKLLATWRNVAAGHPDVQDELAAGAGPRRGSKQDSDETPAAKHFRLHKAQVG